MGLWLLGATAAIGAGAAFASRRASAPGWTGHLRELLRPVIARAGWPPRDDATLRERVEGAVLREEAARGRVDVRVENAAAVLHGELDSPDQVVAARDAARKVRGVRKVTTLISIPGTQRYRHVPSDTKPA